MVMDGDLAGEEAPCQFSTRWRELGKGGDEGWVRSEGQWGGCCTELERKRPWWCRNILKFMTACQATTATSTNSSWDSQKQDTNQNLTPPQQSQSKQLLSSLHCEPQLHVQYDAKTLMASKTLSGSAHTAIMPQFALPVSPHECAFATAKMNPLYANVPKSSLIFMLPSWPAQLNHPPNTYYNVFLPVECWPVVPSFTTYRIITLQSVFEAVELLQHETFQARKFSFEKKCARATRAQKRSNSHLKNDWPPGKICVCGPVGRERGSKGMKAKEEWKWEGEKGWGNSSLFHSEVGTPVTLSSSWPPAK